MSSTGSPVPRTEAIDRGTVFKLTPNGDRSWTESVLHSFNYSAKRHAIDGMDPEASLILDAAGNLYGTDLLWRRLLGPKRRRHGFQADAERRRKLEGERDA